MEINKLVGPMRLLFTYMPHMKALLPRIYLLTEYEQARLRSIDVVQTTLYTMASEPFRWCFKNISVLAKNMDLKWPSLNFVNGSLVSAPTVRAMEKSNNSGFLKHLNTMLLRR